MITQNWKQDVVYRAHSVPQPNLIPYVNKTAYDLAIKALKSGSKTVIETALRELGES